MARSKKVHELRYRVRVWSGKLVGVVGTGYRVVSAKVGPTKVQARSPWGSGNWSDLTREEWDAYKPLTPEEDDMDREVSSARADEVRALASQGLSVLSRKRRMK